MCYASVLIFCICAVVTFEARSAQAWFLAHGSHVVSHRFYDSFSFYADHALVGGRQNYSFKAQYPSDVLIRVFDERHDRFQGFGPNGEAALTVDESWCQDVTEALGKAKRLDVGGYEERMLCYTSARPGDDTVVLFTLPRCPDECRRVMEIQVRAQKREVRVLDKCSATLGVHAGIATQSGLALGLTRAQVQAILGPPLAQRGDKWLYAASVSVKLSDEENVRRGLPVAQVVTPNYPFPVAFEKHIVVWFKGDRVSAFRVNMDWGL